MPRAGEPLRERLGDPRGAWRARAASRLGAARRRAARPPAPPVITLTAARRRAADAAKRARRRGADARRRRGRARRLRRHRAASAARAAEPAGARRRCPMPLLSVPTAAPCRSARRRRSPRSRRSRTARTGWARGTLPVALPSARRSARRRGDDSGPARLDGGVAEDGLGDVLFAFEVLASIPRIAPRRATVTGPRARRRRATARRRRDAATLPLPRVPRAARRALDARPVVFRVPHEARSLSAIP